MSGRPGPACVRRGRGGVDLVALGAWGLAGFVCAARARSGNTAVYCFSGARSWIRRTTALRFHIIIGTCHCQAPGWSCLVAWPQWPGPHRPTLTPRGVGRLSAAAAPALVAGRGGAHLQDCPALGLALPTCHSCLRRLPNNACGKLQLNATVRMMPRLSVAVRLCCATAPLRHQPAWRCWLLARGGGAILPWRSWFRGRRSLCTYINICMCRRVLKWLGVDM